MRGKITSLISLDLEEVERVLSREIAMLGQDEELVDILGYFFQKGGKRLRPMLTILSARCIRKEKSLSPSLIKVAVALELIHNASLIHDDVIDSSPYRRGQLSLHEKFGSETAVLAGDLLYTTAFDLILGEIENTILRDILSCVRRMCQGEIREVRRRILTREDYLKIIQDKTASLMSLCCKSGAILAGASEEESKALEEFGLNFGILYQLIDDEMDGDIPCVKGKEEIKLEFYRSRAQEHLSRIQESPYRDALYNLLTLILFRREKELPLPS